MYRKTTTVARGNQRGAALIVGLMLLLILTVLGVSGLTTNFLELKMAGNTQQAQYAFQSAESALNAEIDAGAPIVFDGDEVSGDLVRGPTDFSYPDADNPVATVEANTIFRQQTFVSTSELGLHFEVRSDATTPENGGRSVQRGGFYVLAPVP